LFAVTERAFDAQARILRSLIEAKSPQVFFEEDLVRRLGTGQARAIIDLYYRRKPAAG
jgi:hypothetical protein